MYVLITDNKNNKLLFQKLIIVAATFSKKLQYKKDLNQRYTWFKILFETKVIPLLRFLKRRTRLIKRTRQR